MGVYILLGKTIDALGSPVPFCEKCGAEMGTVGCKEVVNAKSPEMEKFRRRVDDLPAWGDVTFEWEEYKCPQCGFQIASEEYVRRNKAIRKARKAMQRKARKNKPK